MRGYGVLRTPYLPPVSLTNRPLLSLATDGSVYTKTDTVASFPLSSVRIFRQSTHDLPSKPRHSSNHFTQPSATRASEESPGRWKTVFKVCLHRTISTRTDTDVPAALPSRQQASVPITSPLFSHVCIAVRQTLSYQPLAALHPSAPRQACQSSSAVHAVVDHLVFSASAFSVACCPNHGASLES